MPFTMGTWCWVGWLHGAHGSRSAARYDRTQRVPLVEGARAWACRFKE
jgi:hypothetical protein